jgi:hypothetical protein
MEHPRRSHGEKNSHLATRETDACGRVGGTLLETESDATRPENLMPVFSFPSTAVLRTTVPFLNGPEQTLHTTYEVAIASLRKR